ncbi:MAG: oxidoreductase [Gemmatales bacterium]|nr:MAG: oxidoreductase [Gemmatales bacterium]
MRYRRLGSAGVKVSELCLGTMMFGGATSEEDSIRIIHRAIDDGINFIDTANIYAKGESERIVGKAIRDRRDQIVLATKVRVAVGEGPNDAGASRYHILREFDKSLKRLDLDHVDLYYLHQYDWDTPLEESLRALDDLVRQGKVRYLGCSNYYAYQVCEGLMISAKQNLERFSCVQPLYNIVNRDAEVELFPMCRAHGIGAAVYSPLARGVLTGKYKAGQPFPEGSRAARNDTRIQQTELREESFRVAEELSKYVAKKGVPLSQFALAWTLANPIVTSTIIGPRTMEQYLDNLQALQCQITAEDEDFVDKLVPPGEHTGWGFNDPNYPVRGRPR